MKIILKLFLGPIFVFIAWALKYLKSLFPLLWDFKWSLKGLWKVFKAFVKYGGVMVLVQCEPLLELAYQAISGHRGPVSSFINAQIAKCLNYLVSNITGLNIQSYIDQIPANVMQYACYIGLKGALQLLMDGIITGMALILQIDLTIMVYQINAKLAARALTRR